MRLARAPERPAHGDRALASSGSASARQMPGWLGALTISIVVGVILGVATQRVAGLGAGPRDAIAASTGPWALIAAIVARRGPRVRTALVSSTVCLWAATLAFYLAGGPPGGRGTPGFWLVTVIAVGPVLGLVGRVSAADGVRGSLAAGVLAGWLIGEAVYTAAAYSGASRWLGVAINAAAAICWILAARGPRRVVAATLLPMTAAPIVFIVAAELVSDATFR